jgi:ribonuclease P protein component
VGGAVVRNKVRRRLREILRQMAIKPGADLVFIARTSASTTSFMTLESSVRGLLKRAGLFDIEHEKSSP